jgi:hypothetical protein
MDLGVKRIRDGDVDQTEPAPKRHGRLAPCRGQGLQARPLASGKYNARYLSNFGNFAFFD